MSRSTRSNARASGPRRGKEACKTAKSCSPNWILHDYLRLADAETQAKNDHKEAAAALDRAVLAKYPELTEDEIKTLVVNDKWIAAVEGDVRAEIERVAQTVAGRVKALEERYAEPLPELTAEVEILTERVESHLREMGLTWSTRA